jgi:autotransporter-associated beta strand protein
MHLDKMGEGAMTLSGTHNYTGTTEIWEGDMILNGTLSASPVTLRRFATLAGTAKVLQGITMEYGAILYPGGVAITDTMTIGTTLTLKEGAVINVDLSGNATLNATARQNDFIIINGNLVLGTKLNLTINPTAGIVAEGDYVLAQISGTVTGNLSNFTINGILGRKANLVLESGKLILRITGVRDAGSIAWNGGTTGVWDVSNSANWMKDSNADIFVYQDSVSFTDAGLKKAVTITGTIAPADIKVDNRAGYTFDGTGTITGATSLYKTNTGLLIINNRNDYKGKTIVDGGTLTMKYLPSSVSSTYGGIGDYAITDPAYFEVKDSAIFQVTTANEATTRGLTVSGIAGGLFYTGVNVYWNGIITGSKLTKFGAATLLIGNNNTGLNETVIKAGTIRLNSDAAVGYGAGKKVTLMGGTLEIMNNIGAYLTSSNAIEVPVGATGTIVGGARCENNGALTGGGTLNWSCDYIRAYMNGNWSAFTGNLNIVANGANSTYENHFIVNNNNGFPNATVNLGIGVIMSYKNGTADNGTTTIKCGMLNGAGTFYNAGLEVGANGTNGTFTGIISGATSVNKLGAGLWTLSGVNTYTGTTAVNAGSMTLSGSIATGTLTVANGATLNLTGTTGGSLIVATGTNATIAGIVGGSLANSGTVKGTGTITGASSWANNSITMPGGTSIGTLKFGANVSMNNSATLSMQVTGGSTSCDKVAISGTFTCNGTLEVTIASGTPVLGASYQLFTATSVVGTFVTIKLPVLEQGLEWDSSELYTTGIIKIIASTGFKVPVIKTGVKQNPTTGMFQIYTDYSSNKLNILVTNLQGKMVYQSSVTDNAAMFEVDLFNQPSGIYLLKVVSDKDSSNVLKLIKQ